MRIIYTALAFFLMTVVSYAACTVSEDSFFKNPNCVVVNSSGQIVDKRVVTSPGKPLVVAEYRGNDRSARTPGSNNEPARTFERGYALGLEPKTRQTIDGVREVSRRIQSRVDGFYKSKIGTQLPGVTIDLVNKTRTIRTVIITFSTVEPKATPRTSGRNEGGMTETMGGSGRSHQ